MNDGEDGDLRQLSPEQTKQRSLGKVIEAAVASSNSNRSVRFSEARAKAMPAPFRSITKKRRERTAKPGKGFAKRPVQRMTYFLFIAPMASFICISQPFMSFFAMLALAMSM